MSETDGSISRKPRIVITKASELAWKKSPTGLHSRFYVEGDDTSPEMFEVEVGANFETRQHAHTNDEIIYVVEGRLGVGSARVCDPGDSIFIAANTMYKLVAGDDGCRYITFRGTKSETIHRTDSAPATD